MQFDELSASLRGDLLTPDSAEYDDTRAVYNAMIDKKPSAIAMCVDAADVQTCVNFARDNDLQCFVTVQLIRIFRADDTGKEVQPCAAIRLDIIPQFDAREFLSDCRHLPVVLSVSGLT